MRAAPASAGQNMSAGSDVPKVCLAIQGQERDQRQLIDISKREVLGTREVVQSIAEVAVTS